MKLLSILFAFGALLVSGCATRPADGSCKEYKPIPMCSPGFVEKCQTTRDGCEQCGCEPTVDDSGRSPYEPR
jgi:hypothetical protein